MELFYKKDSFYLRIVACLFIVMYFIMCLFGSKVYANFTVNEKNNDVVLGDLPIDVSSSNDYNCFIITHLSNGLYAITYFTSNDLLYATPQNDTKYPYLLNMRADCYYTCYRYDPSAPSNGWTVYTGNGNYSGSGRAYCMFNPSPETTEFVYSSFNIYDENDNLVFQGASPETTAPVLAGIVQGQEMKPLQEVTGILPIVIVVLVGMIATVKAIRWIMRLMKQA